MCGRGVCGPADPGAPPGCLPGAMQPSKRKGKAGDDLAAIDGFARARDHALLDQIDHTIGEHLRMDAQITPVGERLERRIGNRADTKLERCAVFDEGGDLLSNARMCRVRPLIGQSALDGVERLIPAHGVRNALQRDKALAMNSRHLRIDQRDDVARMIYRRARHVHRWPQRAVAMRIRRGDLEEGDIERQAVLGGEERGNVGEEDGGVAGAPAVHRSAGVRADEERAQAKVSLPALIGIGGWPVGVQVRDLDIMQRLAARDQRLKERRGRGAGALDEDAISRLHGGDRLFKRTPDRHDGLPPLAPLLRHWMSGCLWIIAAESLLFLSVISWTGIAGEQ